MSRHIEPMTGVPEDNLARVKSRVEGRRVASEIWSLIQDTSDSRDEDFLKAMIEKLQVLSGLVPPEKPEQKPEPIARLGKMQMVFGVYKGKPFDEIPLEYLDWLCGEQEDFYRTLRAYLKHPQLREHRYEYLPDQEDDDGD